MLAAVHVTQNRLLAARLQADFKSLEPHLELMHMPVKNEPYESGAKLRYGYFPTTAVFSSPYLPESGVQAKLLLSEQNVLACFQMSALPYRYAELQCD